MSVTMHLYNPSNAEYMAETVGLEGYGIRPAMKVKTDSVYIQKK